MEGAEGFARSLKEADQVLSPGTAFMGAGLMGAGLVAPGVKGHG
jgi:hypothetical protein